MSEQTFYRWKKEYGGMLPSEARELKQLQDENTKLSVSSPTCPRTRSCSRTSFKKVLKPVKQREVMQYLMGRYGVSTRRGCRVVTASERNWKPGR